MKKLLVALLACLSFAAGAAPIAEVREQGVVVRIYDENCKLMKEVTNLPYRATWQEGGKTIEGCAGPFGPVVGAYFADKTVAVIPAAVFTPVKEI